MDQPKNRNQRKKNRTKQRIKLICIAGILLIGIYIAGTSLYNMLDRADTSSDVSGNTSSDFVSSDLPDSSAATNSSESVRSEEESRPVSSETTVDPTDWKLLLVNPWNELPDGFSVELTQLQNGHAVDSRAYPDLQDMMDDMRAEGLSPLICSSYRTTEKQQTLYSNQVNAYLAQGYPQQKAEEEAGKWVAVPNTSEHQTGLAVDIVDISYQILDEKQEDTAVQKWLMENSWKYGYILRYPNEKSEITGIYYEPWHYRYVGKDAAEEIYEQGICLEEYLGVLE